MLDSMLASMLANIYHHHVRSIKSALAQWHLQDDKSLPSALLCILSSILCDDFTYTWNCYAYKLYCQQEKRKNRRIQPKATRKPSTDQIDQKCITYRPIVKLIACNPTTGKSVTVRALLDTGAAKSLISPQLASKLQLRKQFHWPTLVGRFPGSPHTFLIEEVQLELQSLDLTVKTEPRIFEVDAKLISDYRADAQCKELYELAKDRFDVKLTDQVEVGIDDETQSTFDLLLGQNILHADILEEGGFQDWLQLDEKLALFKTKLGWTVLGTFDYSRYEDDSWKMDSNTDTQKGSKNILVVGENTAVDFAELSMTRHQIGFKEKLVVVYHFFKFLHNVAFLSSLLPVLVVVHLPYRFISGTIRTMFTSLKCPKPLKHLSQIHDQLISFLCWRIDTTVEIYYRTISPNISRIFSTTSDQKLVAAEEIPFFFCPQINVQLENAQTATQYQGLVLLDSGAPNSYIDADFAAFAGSRVAGDQLDDRPVCDALLIDLIS